jgi:hypothetical protein
MTDGADIVLSGIWKGNEFERVQAWLQESHGLGDDVG